MRYLVILGDGMADRPLEALQGRTPLEAAEKPCMDKLASQSLCGLVRTIPEGMPCGSDVGNCSVLGLNPRLLTGRAPLEAAAMGLRLQPADMALRCNFVTLSEGRLQDAVMLDYSADEISSNEASQLIFALRPLLPAGWSLHEGVSYRNCLVIKNSSHTWQLTPPHDITNRPVANYLPAGEKAGDLLAFMEAARQVLEGHPVNQIRRARSLRPANAVWFWGQGHPPSLPLFSELYGVKGAMISAVDLLKGIARLSGMQAPDVVGATGNLHTDYLSKVKAAKNAFLEGCEYVYVHIEAPDECGHRGEVENKVKAISLIDQKVLSPLWDFLREEGEPYRILLLPDHPTPLETRTHSGEPVPFCLFDSRAPQKGSPAYTEKLAETGLVLESGEALARIFLEKE